MFGSPHWFRPKTLGFGLIPIRWQGWAYTAAWSSAIGLPFLVLVGRQQVFEALVWVGLSLSALTYDVWHILRAFRQPHGSSGGPAAGRPSPRDDKVLYILDSQPGQPVATRNYNLHVRS